MARIASIFLVTIATLAASRGVVAERVEGVDRETEVLAVVNAFGRAYVEADVETLETLLFEKYVHVNGRSGKVLNRGEWLEWVTSRRAGIENGELIVSDYRIEDVEVVLDGTTAIVIGVVYSSQSRNGNTNTSGFRFSNLWLHRNGAWRRAAFHDSPIP